MRKRGFIKGFSFCFRGGENMNDTLLISIDANHGDDIAVLIVGRQEPNKAVEIVNAFQGQEALDLYKKLVTKNENISNN